MKRALVILLAVLAAGQLALGGIIVTKSRPLPVPSVAAPNINDAAGANRTNIAWMNQDGSSVPPERFVNGDEFYAPPPAVLGTWIVRSVTVWSVATYPTETLGDEFSSVTLYGGTSGVPMVVRSTGGLSAGSNTNSNPNITHTRVWYNPPTNDLQYAIGPVGEETEFPIYMTTFNLTTPWYVTPGSLVQLAVDGVGRAPDLNTFYGYWFAHGCNAATCNVAMDDPDNLYFVMDTNNLADTAYAYIDTNGNGWDKSTDLNMTITFEDVPEPATITLVGLGMLAFGMMRRRRA